MGSRQDQVPNMAVNLLQCRLHPCQPIISERSSLFELGPAAHEMPHSLSFQTPGVALLQDTQYAGQMLLRPLV
jgi:hypothetical protein